MAKSTNRLASLFGDFAQSFELPHKFDIDSQGADLGIPYNEKLISASYNFAPSNDSYEYVAGIGKISNEEIPNILGQVMQSPPIRGITERITSEGKFVVLGSRDGLDRLTDREIQRGFMDDVSRITEAYDQFDKIIKTKNE